MKLRIGLVGLGDTWQHRYRPALRALADRYEVRAVCEEVSLLAQQVAREFDASAVDGFRALAARSDIDAVLMLSPQWYGALPIIAACANGKAIYCAAAWELPSDGAEEVKARVDQSGIAFMAEFPYRHAPATLRLKELIATRLGQPRMLFCHHRRSSEPTGNKRAQVYKDDPVKRDLVELVDWCRYVVDKEPTSVLGVGHQRNPTMANDDYRVMSVDFSESGRTGTGTLAQISTGDYILSNWPEAITFRPPAALQVCCERGVAFVDPPASLVWFDDAGQHMESLESERPVGEQLLSQFHREVTSLVRKTNSLEDTYQALAVVAAAAMSSREGRRVDLRGED